MIRLIEGTVAALDQNTITIKNRGVGYLIHTNTDKLGVVPGDNLTLHTYLAVRETALDLYGFRESIELEWFELLLDVPKIGPKSALQIMSQTDPNLLHTAIVTQDSEPLHKLGGLGKKTAATVVNHFANRLDRLPTSTLSSAVSLSALNPAQTDAIDALVALGFIEKEARQKVLEQPPTSDAKTLIQNVLRQVNP